MACLTNYAVQCRDVTTGKVGCFFFDLEHWQTTGEFKAIGKVWPDLESFFRGEPAESRKSIYLERK